MLETSRRGADAGLNMGDVGNRGVDRDCCVGFAEVSSDTSLLGFLKKFEIVP